MTRFRNITEIERDAVTTPQASGLDNRPRLTRDTDGGVANINLERDGGRVK
jgi:hypothetical protein